MFTLIFQLKEKDILMNLYFRLLRVILVSILSFRRGRRITFPNGASQLWFRAFPFDCDLNGHMTQSRYAAFSDLGRLDWAILMGLGSIIRQKNWAAMAAGIHIEFRREIKPFERFRMETRFLGWSGSNALCEHLYYVVREGEEQLSARALARVGFYSRSEKRFIPGEEIAVLLGGPGQSPEMEQAEAAFLNTRLTKKNVSPTNVPYLSERMEH